MPDMLTITWALIAAMLLLIVYFHGPSYSLQTVRSAPSILTSFGIFGTFLGIAVGLLRFDSADIESSVPIMIDALGVAVWSSVVGILGALSIRLRHSLQSIRQAKKPAQHQVTVADLNSAIVMLNDTVNQLRDDNAKQADRILQSNERYQSEMVDANTAALGEAISNIIVDFNSRIEVQYGENFKDFNTAVGELLSWQKNYASQLDAMLQAQESSMRVMSQASDSFEAMIDRSREFTHIAGSLGELLAGLEKQTSNLEGYLSGLSGLVGQASEGLPALSQYVTELTEKLSSSIEENNRSLTEVLTKAAADIGETVEQVNLRMADSVGQAHTGLAEHVEAMATRTAEQMQQLDESMEKELTQALQTFGYQLTALSEKFVNDYMPLTDRLRQVIEMAEHLGAKQAQTSK